MELHIEYICNNLPSGHDSIGCPRNDENCTVHHWHSQSFHHIFLSLNQSWSRDFWNGKVDHWYYQGIRIYLLLISVWKPAGCFIISPMRALYRPKITIKNNEIIEMEQPGKMQNQPLQNFCNQPKRYSHYPVTFSALSYIAVVLSSVIPLSAEDLLFSKR